MLAIYDGHLYYVVEASEISTELRLCTLARVTRFVSSPVYACSWAKETPFEATCSHKWLQQCWRSVETRLALTARHKKVDRV